MEFKHSLDFSTLRKLEEYTQHFKYLELVQLSVPSLTGDLRYNFIDCFFYQFVRTISLRDFEECFILLNFQVSQSTPKWLSDWVIELQYYVYTWVQPSPLEKTLFSSILLSKINIKLQYSLRSSWRNKFIRNKRITNFAKPVFKGPIAFYRPNRTLDNSYIFWYLSSIRTRMRRWS